MVAHIDRAISQMVKVVMGTRIDNGQRYPDRNPHARNLSAKDKAKRRAKAKAARKARNR